MEQWFMKNARQLLRQFGPQRICDLSPSLYEPVQGIMDIDVHPESVVYDSGDHIPNHLQQSNGPVFTLTFQEEDHGGPGQFRRYTTLPERQLCHTHQWFSYGPVWFLLPFWFSEPHIQMLHSHPWRPTRYILMDTPYRHLDHLLNGQSIWNYH